MPHWNSKPVWQGCDAFVIGGGPSLRAFDWDRLLDRLTVGCNSAYLHGPEICKVCVFGDGDPNDKSSFWSQYRNGLAAYAERGGTVFTNHPALYLDETPWLWTTQRQARGLSTTELGWNRNTGAIALNLALLFGAKRVFLLGFDMKPGKDRQNWHPQQRSLAPAKLAVYRGFVNQFRYVVRDWHDKFKDRLIVNVTEDSGLPADWFPRIKPDDLWAAT
jgi:hypothetical protein